MLFMCRTFTNYFPKGILTLDLHGNPGQQELQVFLSSFTGEISERCVTCPRPQGQWSQHSNPGPRFSNPALSLPCLTATPQGHAVKGCWRKEWKRKQKRKA